MAVWRIFRGAGEPHDGIKDLPGPPPWRDFEARWREGESGADPRGESRVVSDPEIQMVNAALYLRRPLLVTGAPGVGKTTLAYAVARELKLGRVLRWSINSRSTLAEGQYSYDALGRLRDLQAGGDNGKGDKGIGAYITLGPIGSAFAAKGRPRVLLVDEIDKADLDLPNDLLHVLEEGEFVIPELHRVRRETPKVPVHLFGDASDEEVEVEGGRVRCTHFPFILLTSNGERDLPEAFRRRCLSLKIEAPNEVQLGAIIRAHFPSEKPQAEPSGVEETRELLETFLRLRDKDRRVVATDQLLNAIFLLASGRPPSEEEWESVREAVLSALDR